MSWNANMKYQNFHLIIARIVLNNFLSNFQLNGTNGYRNGGIDYDDLSTTDLSECCNVSSNDFDVMIDFYNKIYHNFVITVDIQRKNSCLITKEFFANVAKCWCDAIHFCVTSHASYSLLFGHRPWSNWIKISHSKHGNERHNCKSNRSFIFDSKTKRLFTYFRIALPSPKGMQFWKLVMSLLESFKFNYNQRILSGSRVGSGSGANRSCLGCSLFHREFHRCSGCSNGSW